MKKIFTLLTLLVVTSIFPQIPSYVPTNGLIGYWPFNGNANDESGNGNNGTINGATLTNDRLGNTNKAYSFNGVNNFILIPDNQSLNSNYITVSIWFQTSSSNFGSLIYRTGDNAINEQFGCVLNYPTINNTVWSIKNGNNCSNPSAGWQTTNMNYNVNDGNWHNIICIYDGTNSMMYLDNAMIAFNSFLTAVIDACEANINIGKGYNSTYPFSGKIDDIGIWNRALTQAEITGLYSTLNTSQNMANNTITIYPNPANDHITIDCGNLADVSGYQIKIVNTLGQEVFSGAMNTQQYVVPLNTWGNTGVYFVKIYDASNNLLNTKKIILQ